MKGKNCFLTRAAMMLLLVLLCSVGTWADELKIIVGPTNGAATVIGNLNADGGVDGNDVQVIADYIMNPLHTTTDWTLLDINGDQKVDAADIVMLTDIIKSKDEVVYVAADGEAFAFQVQTSVAYDAKTSAPWIILDPEAKDGQHYVTVGMNSSVRGRAGTVTLTSKDGTLSSSLTIVQAGKEDGRYIEIDWEKATLDSYDAETGKAVITFKDDVPVMGKYDAFLMPQENDFIIRVIDVVELIDGKTVTLATSEGDLGNIFKETEFTLAFGEQEAMARSRGAAGKVIQPMKVELFDGKKYVEVYNADVAKTRGEGDNGSSADAKIRLDYSGEDIILSNDGYAVAKIDEVKYNVSLSALMYMKFTKKKWYEVWKGEVSDMEVQIHGQRDYDMKATHTIASVDEVNTLKESVDYDPYFNPLPELAYTSMVFTFKKDNKVVRALVKMQLFQLDFGHKGIGFGTAKTHVSNSTDFAVVEDNIITYGNPNNDIDDTDLSFHFLENRTEGRFVYRLDGEFSIRMFGTEVYSADFSPGDNKVFFCRESTNKDNDGRLGNYAYVHVAKMYSGKMGVGKFADLEKETILYDRNLIPGYLEMNGKLADQEEYIKLGENTISFHAYHQDYEGGHRFDSQRALIKVKVVSASRNEQFTLETDDQGNADFPLIYDEYDEGGYVEATIYNPYKDLYKDAPSDMTRIFKFHPVGYKMECLTSGVKLPATEESVPMTFEVKKFKDGVWSPVNGKWVYFEADAGTVSPESETTDAGGKVTTTFTQAKPDIASGVVEASCSAKEAVYNDPNNVFKLHSFGTIVKEQGGGGGSVFDLAKKLKDNTYVVRDKDGNESTRGLLQDWSQWNRGKAGCDGETRVIKISLEDGKVDQETGSVDTQGGGYFEIPIDKFGEPMQLLLDYLSNYGAIQGSFFTFKKPEEGYSSSNYINLKFGCGDMHNLKDGTVQLQKKSSSAQTRGETQSPALEEDYSGELELVFAFTFTNFINENGEDIEDGEYTVYGKAAINEFTPKITYYKLEPESGFVGVGKSVAVNVKDYSDEDAVWNWNDVELVASYVDYANYETDEGYFSWDSATHSLTSLKTNNNESVYVRFRLKSYPELTSYFTIRTGDGWPYTAFTISPAEQTVEHGYNCQFNVESYEPTDIAWDPYAIEIDPATNPGAYLKYFIYEPGFPRFRCSYAAKAGTYDVRMRLMSDHSVGFTMKITVTAEE